MKQKEGFPGERKVVLPPAVIEMERNDPLMSNLYITDIGYYPKACNHYMQRKEPIREFVLIYCVEGEGWYELNGKHYPVEENQYFILPAGMPHAYGSEEENPWTIYWIHFTGDNAPVYAEDSALPQSITPSLNSRISDRNGIFEEIYQTVNENFSRENLRYASSLLHHYLASIRFLQQFRNANARAETEDMINETVRFMKENLEKRLSMKELSAYTGYSSSYLHNHFKEKIGDTPLNCFNKLKMEAACAMLRESNLKINQICHKVGIDDCYYFTRLFTKTVGMSPTEYRNRKNAVCQPPISE